MIRPEPEKQKEKVVTAEKPTKLKKEEDKDDSYSECNKKT